MPAIRKIRIVNFRFNDGAKLIPDEIFCTENGEGKPIDTLLNLENGGGKSVLVQLMLQPICPKAKVQNRNISKFFQKGTDHAFVLIEWALDCSSNSLLTGIALAASINADDENERKNIRFYTFLHDYTCAGDKLDLINLPLTEKNGSNIRALSFDDLRKLLQSRKVEYFPSDQQRRYQKRLEEYGILHTEWENILVRINGVEGGVVKFFEEYKTADNLLDRFIIPGVMQNETEAERSIEEMFLHYAKSYAGQEENLRLQSQLIAFTERLKNMLPLLKTMWDASDTKTQAIRRLSDHLFTLEHKIKQNAEQKEELESTIQSLQETRRHILAEQASEAYYIAKDQYDAAEANLAESSQNKTDAKEQQDSYGHLLNVLNAAKEYAELTALKNQEKALYAQLRELDSDNMDAHIVSLRYSLYLAAKELESRDSAVFQQETDTLRSHSDALTKIEQSLSELEQQCSAETGRCNQMIGRRDALLEQIGAGLDSLGRTVAVMLDGSYSSGDIQKIRDNFNYQKTQAESKLNDYNDEEQRLNREISEHDNKCSKLLHQQAGLEVKIRELKRNLSQYRERYDAAVQILEHLSLPAESLFSDEPLACLKEHLEDCYEQLRQSERSAELLKDQLSCIENGQLHISKNAVSFLQETGIPFQTGEHYLLHQSRKIRETILAVNPLAAYAAIVDSEKERRQLMSQTAAWLSSIVPVYTLSELADMAERNWDNGASFLTAYDKAYFSDSAAYGERIRAALADVQAEIQRIRHQIDEWETEKTVLMQFDYAVDAEKTMLFQADSYEKEQTELQEELSALNSRKNEIRSRSSELKSLQNEQAEQIRSIEHQRNEFERICGIMADYDRICSNIASCEANCRKLSDSMKHSRSQKEKTETQIQNCETKIKSLETQLDEYSGLVEELRDCPETEQICADYPELLEEYRIYREQRSSDRQGLQKSLQNVQEQIRKAEKGMKRFHIAPEEYENTEYSDSAYHNAENLHQQAEDKYEQSCDAHTNAVAAFASAESVFNQAKNKLNELHTKLLERSEVSSDHERRIAECECAFRTAENELRSCERILDELFGNRKYAAKYAARYREDIEDYTPKITEEMVDTETLRDEIELCIDALHQTEESAKAYHRRELEPFRDTHSLFTGTLDGMMSVIGNQQIHGDKYFTLYERTAADIRRYGERIGQLAVVLRDVEDSRQELVTHCCQRAGRLYENLTILSKKSNVQIGGARKQMLRVGLPEIESSSELPTARINTHIEEQVKLYLSEQDATAKIRRSHLEIRRLLNCYIGTDNIPITVYKIDRNPQNSRYRSWEDALSENSGGEQFVVLFSLVVSVMNYTRSMTDSLSHASGVLILDNPFGPISSPHLLAPMFDIAHRFHIQLICLTHLGTAAVTNCFDMVYQLRFRTLPLSNLEILEAEAKHHMEHAYYLSEQLSLL